jgi:tRNA(Ile)-lysidine synthase
MFEWFLMQLSKGSGLVELLGMQTFEEKKNYTIFRPLLNITKNDLENFLKENSIKYFIDSSNLDEKYRRNYFRKNFSNEFLNEFSNGVKNSFSYLKNDLKSLNIKEVEPIFEKFELEVFENLNDDNLNIRVIDRSLKKRGFLLSQKQRVEILSQKNITISHKINISISENYIYIKKIPQNIRGYIFLKNISLDFIK